MSNNNIQVFENEEFGSIRTVLIDGQPWFVGKDVALALGYSNTSKAVLVHVDSDDKESVMLPNSQNGSSVGKHIIINESGLYSLILSSKLDTAKKFKRWVTSEVLPSIRKYGFYANDERLDDIEDGGEKIKELVRKAKEERRRRIESEHNAAKLIEEKDALIAELNPKADFCDDVLTGERLMNVTMIAKDYGMSAQEMNGLLKSFGIQYKLRREQLWVITAKYQHLGLTKTVMYNVSDGKYRQFTLWTETGRKFIYDLLKEKGILPQSERLIQAAMENYYDNNEEYQLHFEDE